MSYTELTSKEQKTAAFLNWVWIIMILLAMGGFFWRGVGNYSIYAQGYDRSVAVIGNATGNRSGPFYLRIRMDSENFPGISSETIDRAKAKNLEKWLQVSPRVYDAIKAGDYINVEYAEHKERLYARYADNRMPDWMYFIFSLLCFLLLRKTMGWEFPMQYFGRRKFP